jgi:hypothetical protein
VTSKIATNRLHASRLTSRLVDIRERWRRSVQVWQGGKSVIELLGLCLVVSEFQDGASHSDRTFGIAVC